MASRQLPAFFINLQADEARRMHMESEAQRCGVELQRIAATTKAEADVECPKLVASGVHAGDLACCLSHREAWRRIAHSGADFGAVFEDDICFGDGIAALLADTAWIPRGVELIKLETFVRPVLLVGAPCSAPAEHAVWKLRSEHLGSAGYIISATWAAELAGRAALPDDSMDRWLFGSRSLLLSRGAVAQLWPAVCIQQGRSARRFLPPNATLSNLTGTRSRGTQAAGAMKKSALQRFATGSRIALTRGLGRARGALLGCLPRHRFAKVPFE